MKLLSKVTAVSTACFMTLTIAPASYAARPALSSAPSVYSPASSSTQLSKKEMAQLEKDVEVLFTRYVQIDSSGQFFVNIKNLIADGGQSRASELQRLVNAFNLLDESP